MPESNSNITDRLTTALDHEGEILKVAMVKTLAQVQANPTTDNLRNHAAAKLALEKYNRDLQLKTDPDSVCFKTVAEAYRYAQGLGYRRSRVTMDNHIEAGFLARRPDGTITKPTVDAYLAMQAGESTDNPAAELELRDQAAKTKKTEAQAEVWDLRARRERGDLIERDQVEGLLARRAAFLRQDLESFFRVLAPELVDLVKGDEERVFDLTEFGLDKLEDYLDRYSRPMQLSEIKPIREELQGEVGSDKSKAIKMKS